MGDSIGIINSIRLKESKISSILIYLGLRLLGRLPKSLAQPTLELFYNYVRLPLKNGLSMLEVHLLPLRTPYWSLETRLGRAID
jgi:hypothetical protein